MKPATHRSNRGFTLVELLVVITIIVVLAAVTLIVSKRMVSNAKAAKSVGNMREVSTMVIAHAAENGGRLPALSPMTKTGDGVRSRSRRTR